MNWLTDLTSRQWWAGARQAITATAGAVLGIAVALGYVSAGDKVQILQTLDTVYNNINTLMVSLAALAGLITTVINTFKAMRNSSPASSVAVVAAMAQTPATATEAKTALTAAANALPEVAGVITRPGVAGDALAASVPDQNVVPAGTALASSIAKGST